MSEFRRQKVRCFVTGGRVRGGREEEGEERGEEEGGGLGRNF